MTGASPRRAPRPACSCSSHRQRYLRRIRGRAACRRAGGGVVKDPRDIIIRPVVSEKSYEAFDANVYTFVVAHDANKIEIRKAVEELFATKVEKVRTIN